MAPEPSTTLPGFLVFVQKMRPHLLRVQRSDVDALLKCLYQAAERKINLENRRLGAHDQAKEMREFRKSMSETKKLFGQRS